MDVEDRSDVSWNSIVDEASELPQWPAAERSLYGRVGIWGLAHHGTLRGSGAIAAYVVEATKQLVSFRLDVDRQGYRHSDLRELLRFAAEQRDELADLKRRCHENELRLRDLQSQVERLERPKDDKLAQLISQLPAEPDEQAEPEPLDLSDEEIRRLFADDEP